MQFHFLVIFANATPTLATRYRSRPLENASELPSDRFWADLAINTTKHDEFSKKSKNQQTRGHLAPIHLHELSLYFSWPELHISAMPLRFLLLFHNLLTSKICFSCSVGVKFHIIIALLLQRCEKRICICNTPSEIMQSLCEFCSHTRWEAYFGWFVISWWSRPGGMREAFEYVLQKWIMKF